MEKSFRSLISLSTQSLAYGLGFYGRQIVIYLTLPLLTRLMTQEEYGVISVLTSFYTVINTITNVGLPSATFRLYNDQDNLHDQSLIIGSSQAIFLIISILGALVLIVFASSISSVLLGSIAYASSVRVIAFLLIFETMNYFGSIMLRLSVRPGAVSIHSIFFIITQMGTAIYLLKFQNAGVLGYWLGYLFGGIVSLVLMIWFNRREIVFVISKVHTKKLLSYALPLIPATFSLNLLQLTDRYFIGSYVGLESVAVYAIGYKIGSFVNLILAPFRIAWPNFAFSTLKKDNAKNIYRDVLTYVLMISMFFVLFINIYRNEFIQLITPDSYQNAGIIVPWIALSMVFLGLYPLFSLGPRVKKKTGSLAWLTFGITIINIILNVTLVKRFGFFGSALAALISYLLLAVSSIVVGRKYYFYPIDGKRLIKIFVAFSAVMIFSESKILYNGLLLEIILKKMGTLLIYPLLLLILKLIPLQDMKLILQESKDCIEAGIRINKD